ncbi:unnamed protein product [Linum trigynum]|uniref:Uncharacterized protein n=1 Tax=Linum trigynum TaxID=586398 RepID=A0AAV2DXE8_9ROSI
MSSRVIVIDPRGSTKQFESVDLKQIAALNNSGSGFGSSKHREKNRSRPNACSGLPFKEWADNGETKQELRVVN